jgi:hypothetical protein
MWPISDFRLGVVRRFFNELRDTRKALTDVQERCTALITENREYKASLRMARRDYFNLAADQCKAQADGGLDEIKAMVADGVHPQNIHVRRAEVAAVQTMEKCLRDMANVPQW